MSETACFVLQAVQDFEVFRLAGIADGTLSVAEAAEP
jgi:hypothetical protein